MEAVYQVFIYVFIQFARQNKRIIKSTTASSKLNKLDAPPAAVNMINFNWNECTSIKEINCITEGENDLFENRI